MTYDEAIDIVIDDVRRSYPDMTGDEALAHARNTIDLSNLDETDADNAQAYRMVL